jgi:Flp pilus assembly protein TadD
LAVARSHRESYPDSPTALARLAQAELSAGHREKAKAAAISTLDQLKRVADPSAELAAVEVLRATGDAAAARSHLANTGRASNLARAAEARLAIDCGDFLEAQALLEGAETTDGVLLLAWLALRESRYPDAISLLRRAMRITGPAPTALINLAYAHAALGHLSNAIRATREAQALAPHQRLAAFNLVSFQLAAGDFLAANDALRPLRRLFPNDIEVALAAAFIAIRAQDQETAHRELQRARTSSAWASAPNDRRAELEANLAMLRWWTAQRGPDETRGIVLDQLKRTEYRSLAIAGLLPGVFTRCSERPGLEQVVKHLEVQHQKQDLTFLAVFNAMLGREAKEAVDLAVEWAHREILNSTAASTAILLVGDLAGDYEQAIQLGLDALSRAPRHASIVNNVAYVLALADRAHEARRILSRVDERTLTIPLIATCALVDLGLGNMDAGVAGYERARQRALDEGNERMADLVEANLKLALHRLNSSEPAKLERDGAQHLGISHQYKDDPTYWVLSVRAEREGLAVEFV